MRKRQRLYFLANSYYLNRNHTIKVHCSSCCLAVSFYIVDQTVFFLLIIVSASQVPGEVAVTVVTDAGKKLGMTCFRYIDEMREMVRQIVKDPTLQSLWFAMWSQEHGFFGNDSNIAQVLGPIDLQGQGEVK